MPETVTEADSDDLRASNLTPGNGKPGSTAVKAREMLELQAVLKKIVTGAVKQTDDGEVIDIPAREIAQSAVAFVKIDQHRRYTLGLPNPKPIESPRRAKSKAQPTAPTFSEPK